ncbi:cell elongation-specific peptidoglycan D,D-transpeptidase [Thermanaeromonas toyohensis ToBE]|uniref:Cell elongation-specific peptidoglycan D,D-transpeptidase n=1 Tax=Thermanaeromonas toyohensis ToBE TaxID=698762 RepID=A0A1W1VMQ0_9FIRM|nr:penicillin-binding transpeptidase domain-containing protein [Thermanaeromonas toyohensis]SMB94665.1 cell elongation-specific peptidoglycan D,D-transpeptidase [Thermanaeromonas toyohensis ToBE]
MGKHVRHLALTLMAMFFVLILHLTYLQVLKAEGLYLHPLNPRLKLLEEKTLRGDILDREGRVLARSSSFQGRVNREYPLGRAAAHVIGYASPRLGTSGLEAAYDGELLGLVGSLSYLNEFRRLQGLPRKGYGLLLTLDAELQRLAFQLLEGYRGAVVALNPRTGEVLALASSPSFDPQSVEEQWELLQDPRQGSPFLNRAIQGLYPPGSTMKLVVAAAALERNFRIAESRFYCPGYIEIEGRRLTCPQVHGNINFRETLMYSCNVTFAQLALEVGPVSLKKAADNFGFNQALSFDLPVVVSQAPFMEDSDANLLAEGAIGQGKVLATPWQMALVAAAIANKGLLMKPFLVAKVIGDEGEVVKQTQPRLARVATTPNIAQVIKEAMVATVEEGTGRSARLQGLKVAGKTGSAQNPQGKAHSWFIGFAPADNPQIAVSVIMENAGAGAEAAAPVAREIIAKALRR